MIHPGPRSTSHPSPSSYLPFHWHHSSLLSNPDFLLFVLKLLWQTIQLIISILLEILEVQVGFVFVTLIESCLRTDTEFQMPSDV